MLQSMGSQSWTSPSDFKVCGFSIIIIIIFTALGSMWDLSSLTKDQICTHCIGSTVT